MTSAADQAAIATLIEQIQEARREVRLRSQAYPKLISEGRMSQAQAARHLGAMRDILATLEWLHKRNADG